MDSRFRGNDNFHPYFLIMKSGVGVIVVAAGKGTRLKCRVDKPYVTLGNKPLVCHCLEVFQKSALVGEIVLVVRRARLRLCREKLPHTFSFPKVIAVVAGGRTRQESVAKGLEALTPSAGVVVVHDAARPFVCVGMVRDVVRWASKGIGVTLGVPVTQTIKRVGAGGMVVQTPSRQNLREIQTPQAFPRALLQKAHEVALRDGVQGSDDAGLVERIGVKVKVIPGTSRNIKITTPEDLKLAEILLRKGKDEGR